MVEEIICVFAHRSRVTVAATLHNQGFVTTAEQMPKELVPPVKAESVGVNQPAGGRSVRPEPVRGVVIIILRPETHRLLERQAAAQARVVVRVGHGVARPQGRLPAETSAQASRPFCGQTARVITKRRPPRRVNHVHQAVQRAEELPKSRTDPLKNQELTP